MSLNKNIINKFKNIENISFNFEQNINGKIESVAVTNRGSEYNSAPDIQVTSTGVGRGAVIRPIIENGKFVDIKINNPGIGYSTSSSILVTTVGSNEFLDSHVRSFTIDLSLIHI